MKSSSIQKNMLLISILLAIGISLIAISIALICSYTIYGIIIGIFIIIGLLIAIAVLILQGVIGRIVISNDGIVIKEKRRTIFIAWRDFTDCKIMHPIGRGYFKIILIAKEKSYKIYNEQYAIEKLIQFCTNDELGDKLKMQMNE